MDEATSRLAMELESVPSEIDQVQRRLVQLELAARQLADETEEHAKQRRAEIQAGNDRAPPQAGRPAPAMGVGKERTGRRPSIRSRLAEVELAFNQLAARHQGKAVVAACSCRKPTTSSSTSWTCSERSCRATGEGPSESSRRRHRPAAACGKKSGPRKSPRWSAPGPASRSAA